MKRKISKGGGERLGSITKHWNKHGFKTATVFAITQNWLLLEFCLQDILTRTWISSKEVSKYSKARHKNMGVNARCTLWYKPAV